MYGIERKNLIVKANQNQHALNQALKKRKVTQLGL